MNSVPLTIGLIGHRNIRPDEENMIVEQFDHFLTKLIKGFHNNEILVLTALAKGSDRLISKSKFRDQIKVAAILPLDIHEYKKDFDTNDDLLEFESEVLRSNYLLNLDGMNKKSFTKREDAYQACGKWIVDHSDIVILIWNGKLNTEIGGTADSFKYFFESDFESKKLVHILASNGVEEKIDYCDCSGHTPTEVILDFFARNLDFNQILKGTSDSEDYLQNAMKRLDLEAVFLRKKHIFSIWTLLILGILTVNLFGLQQQLHHIGLLIISFGALIATYIYWIIFRRNNFKKKFEESRFIAESLRTQLWWRDTGVEFQISDDLQSYREIDSQVASILNNLLLIPKLKKFDSHTLNLDPKKYLQEQIAYLNGTNDYKGAILRNIQSSFKYSVLSKTFLSFSLVLLLADQFYFSNIEFRLNSWQAAIPSLTISFALSMAAAFSAYSQIMGFDEISSKYKSSLANFQASLIKLMNSDRNIDFEQKIIEEIGRDSFRESVFWFKVKGSKNVSPF